jgi:hypothetical protein
MAANIAIPKFDPGCKVHQQLAALSQTAHQRVALGQALDDVDRNLTIAVKELWNIAP